MSSLPSLKPADVIRKLRKTGFVFDRHAKGSHEIWYNPETRRRTVVPNHPGKDIPKGTLRAIIDQAGLNVNEFVNL
ncbi:MAG: type II toxin-antitoxin system HicA family toxin [Candidatus Omnitrophica bacterium]|nr:type II toxin-antitoxin system HicA family toxin [Candidatus Omnitrophota bacterium]